MSRKQKKRRALKGLSFNYKREDEVRRDKYQSKNDFLKQCFNKTNDLAPKQDDEVFNVLYNGMKVDVPKTVRTVQDLYDFLSSSSVIKTNTSRGIGEVVLKRQQYERVGRRYSPDEVLPFIFSITGEDRKFFGEELINMDSKRYVVFSQSLVCDCCGKVGKYFVKERDKNRSKNVNPVYHFNLYSNENGIETLMCKNINGINENGKSVYVTRCKDCVDKKYQERNGQKITVV